ncbi:hypothetical protein RKD19_006371 [Streptomyces canus]
MSPAITLAAGEASEHRPLIISLFAVFVVATLVITVWAGRQTKDASDFYAGGRQFTGFQNGLAVSGDYMSAASFLGIAGAIALFGYDGFLYSIGFLVAWLVALLLVAEPLRNSPAATRWVTSSRTGCASARSVPRPAPPPSSSRSSTCWPRWRARASWSPCCSASPATPARSASSPWSAS